MNLEEKYEKETGNESIISGNILGVWWYNDNFVEWLVTRAAELETQLDIAISLLEGGYN